MRIPQESPLTAVTLVTIALIVVGLVGIVIPVLPGLALVWLAVAVWALARHDGPGWIALGIATVLAALGTAAKYLLPGRRLRTSGVGWRTLAVGGVLGVAGFFMIPVVGLFIGFVLGIYLAERVRIDRGRRAGRAPAAGPPDSEGADQPSAWDSTQVALVAIGWSIAIELSTGLLITLSWVVTALAS